MGVELDPCLRLLEIGLQSHCSLGKRGQILCHTPRVRAQNIIWVDRDRDGEASGHVWCKWGVRRGSGLVSVWATVFFRHLKYERTPDLAELFLSS